MNYNLENKVLLSEDSENKSLYQWSLQELDKDGKKIGRDLIPWKWSVYFTASELRYHYSLDIDKSEDADENVESTEYKENIFGLVHAGTCRDGKNLEGDVLYSMLGTNRRIKHFRLSITKTKNSSDKERCHIHGSVSYTAENDFREEVTNDHVYVGLALTPEHFNKIAELIKTRSIDVLEICLGNVSGFYSDWSPSVSTGHIKILTDSKDHKVIKQDSCKIDPPRLGGVSEFNMSITQRRILNSKQDLRGVDIDKLFEMSEVNNDEKEKKQEFHLNDKYSLMMSQLARNEEVLKKLSIPLWLIFIILCFLAVKFI